MKVKVFFLALFVSLFSLVSFAQNATTDQNKETDGQILNTLVALNTGEVSLAKLALQKSKNATVRQFARRMVMDHSKNINQTKALAKSLKITLVTSNKAKNLQQNAQDEMNKLNSLSGKDFDKEYIDAMVNDHQDAVNLLNNDLIPNATNAKVVAHLKATSATIAQHLQMAKDDQKKIEG